MCVPSWYLCKHKQCTNILNIDHFPSFAVYSEEESSGVVSVSYIAILFLKEGPGSEIERTI
jgi:hypothetical protein